MHKHIQDYLKRPERKLVQARIDSNLVAEAQKIMDKEHLTWINVISGCLKFWIDEHNEKDRGRKN